MWFMLSFCIIGAFIVNVKMGNLVTLPISLVIILGLVI